MLVEDVLTFMNVSLSHPVVGAAETSTGNLGVVGARFIMDGDEYSFILEGQWGFWQGGDVAFAGPGDLVYKPRDVWHTFWNATDRPGRLLEIISPAGFDQFFVELAALVTSGPVDGDAVAALNAAYGLQVDPNGTARIAAEYRLVTVPR